MKFLIPLFFASSLMAAIPDFVSLGEMCPEMVIGSNYSTPNNFTGSIVAGYKAQKAFMARGPAEALKRVHEKAKKQGYALKIYDSYRPVKAVQFFLAWSLQVETNPEIKEQHYPTYTRNQLFDAGYIAKRSSHSRGSAVDLTLVDLKNGKELDMGTIFDFFGDLSHTDSRNISSLQRKNRLLLKGLMESEGFQNFSQEWWHYSIKPGPYPNQEFDFDVE